MISKGDRLSPTSLLPIKKLVPEFRVEVKKLPAKIASGIAKD